MDRVVGAARRRGAAQPIESSLPDALPLIRADATLVEQAIGNVVANAIIHTPRETRIVIHAVNNDSEMTLRVTDDGPGIAAEALPHIFDKFARAPAGPADGGESTGLGLAIAKGIMEAHGGSIRAESPIANGRGARFILVFQLEVSGP